MATSITITITPTRALTAEGRLVAGETAEVAIGGATPTALYLVAPDQTVIAACEAFTPTGQGSGGTGFLQLATAQVAALFAHTPAGRMVAVWALVNGADGVAGAGWIPVVSAPMPDELVDLDIDFYLRASQVGAGLAIVDGKLVCTISPATPIAPSTDPSAAGKPADAKATGDALEAIEEAAQFREWFPGGEAKSIADCTPNLKFDWANADNVNHTVNVLPFCNTDDSDSDNSDKTGRVVIPPYADHEGVRYRVVGVSNGDQRGSNANLTAIVAPTTVTSIGSNAFSVCSSLSYISLPAATDIGNGAFDGTHLTSVSLPAATSIESGAFGGCAYLTSVSFPVVTSIGVYAFIYCSSLSSVDFGSTVRQSVPTLGTAAFPDLSGRTCRIIIPDGQYAAWTADTDWSALTAMGYVFVRWSDTRPATREYVDAGLAGKQDALTSQQLSNIAAVPMKADAVDLRYAAGATITASAQLADRTGNRVVPPADNTADIVLTFPNAATGYLRDFLVLITNTAGNTGSITFTAPTGAVVYGDGFSNSPASGETWLYSVTEEAANVFWCKSEKMEVAQ